MFKIAEKWPRRLPKLCWTDTLHIDLELAGVHPDLALKREWWRYDTRGAYSPTKKSGETRMSLKSDLSGCGIDYVEICEHFCLLKKTCYNHGVASCNVLNGDCSTVKN